jgi:hypothetical protein
MASQISEQAKAEMASRSRFIIDHPDTKRQGGQAYFAGFIA